MWRCGNKCQQEKNKEKQKLERNRNSKGISTSICPTNYDRETEMRKK
jgi:hypothetical protein